MPAITFTPSPVPFPKKTLPLLCALMLQKAIIVTPDPSEPATRGQEIDHVPRSVSLALRSDL